jgi:ABC-type Na+ efflux pump permease subunit
MMGLGGFSMGHWWSIVLKEFLQLKRDRLTLGMIVGLPLIQLFLFGYVINSDPKQMPTAVIDADQTEITRTVVATMKATGYFRIVGAYDEAAAGYRQTVLQGLREVADSLSALDADALALAAREAVTEHARAGGRIAEQQYRLGGISELALLDAQRQLLQAELDRVTAEADRYSDTATLFQALGGGWWQPGSS